MILREPSEPITNAAARGAPSQLSGQRSRVVKRLARMQAQCDSLQGGDVRGRRKLPANRSEEKLAQLPGSARDHRLGSKSTCTIVSLPCLSLSFRAHSISSIIGKAIGCVYKRSTQSGRSECLRRRICIYPCRPTGNAHPAIGSPQQWLAMPGNTTCSRCGCTGLWGRKNPRRCSRSCFPRLS